MLANMSYTRAHETISGVSRARCFRVGYGKWLHVQYTTEYNVFRKPLFASLYALLYITFDFVSANGECYTYNIVFYAAIFLPQRVCLDS